MRIHLAIERERDKGGWGINYHGRFVRVCNIRKQVGVGGRLFLEQLTEQQSNAGGRISHRSSGRKKPAAGAAEKERMMI